MKRVKHFLLASCLFPALLGAQEMANANFLELTPDAQSAGMAGTGLAITITVAQLSFITPLQSLFHRKQWALVIHMLISTRTVRCTAHLFSIGSEEKVFMDLLWDSAISRILK